MKIDTKMIGTAFTTFGVLSLIDMLAKNGESLFVPIMYMTAIGVGGLLYGMESDINNEE